MPAFGATLADSAAERMLYLGSAVALRAVFVRKDHTRLGMMMPSHRAVAVSSFQYHPPIGSDGTIQLAHAVFLKCSFAALIAFFVS